MNLETMKVSDKIENLMFPVHWKEAKFDKNVIRIMDKYLDSGSKFDKSVIEELNSSKNISKEDVVQMGQII